MKRLILLVACFSALQSYGQKAEAVYLNATDSTVNYYVAVMPHQIRPRALIVLMPGAFQTPEYVLQQTDFPQYAAQQGILTIVPLLADGIHSFDIDLVSQQSLDQQIQDAVKRYSLKGKDFYIGGFSLGGSAAVKYAAQANEANSTLLKPTAVFAIDPPLDFERYYNAAKRITRLSQPAQLNPEITYMLERIEKEMKGTPQNALINFHKLSPYSYSDSQQYAVKLLVHTPLMLLTEPDVDWWLQERGYDYSLMNCTDQAAMINELQRLGNKHAVLVTSQNKGYRKPGHQKHPHSFSIADDKQLLQWLLGTSSK